MMMNKIMSKCLKTAQFSVCNTSSIQKTKSKVFLIFNLLLIGVFSILFSALGSADLYLNSKVGSIYFNTSGIARASIGPGGNFSINTSDFFVNIENSDDKFMKVLEFSKVQFLENGERIVHTSDFFVNQETFDEAVRIINDNIMLSIDNNIANGNEIENN